MSDINHYFVDESGDLTFFNKKGKPLLGTNGVSKTFILGICKVNEPTALNLRVQNLKNEILANKNLARIPSVAKKNRNFFFHCKDDPPEIRELFFNVIEEFEPRFFIIVRRKIDMIQSLEMQHSWGGQKLKFSDIYDDLIKRASKNLLHKADSNFIISKRGKSIRSNAISNALERAQKNFYLSHGIEADTQVKVEIASPEYFGGLQLMDYG